MTGRTEDIRTQVQSLWKQAVVQVGGVTGHVAKAVADRLGTDRSDLIRRRNRLLSRLSIESGRLADQRTVPLPGVVKHALGRVHEVLEHIAIDDDDSMQTAAASDASEPLAREARSDAESSAIPRSGKSTPRRSRKRRRPNNGEHPAGS
jgi:hypothetical protein